MRTKKLHFKNSYPALILYLYCAAVHANDIKGSLSATSMFSDNSLKAAEEPIEERQDLYRVGLSADYSNWLVEAEADYNWVSHQFTEQSQPDDRYAEGSSSILFGKQEDPLALELTHSQRILLITPDAVALNQNQQERVMISALPQIRTRIFAADRLTLGGQFVQVSFPDDELQDSQREGLSLGWLRPLSTASFLQLNAQQQTISFEFFPAADYTYSGAMMVYGVKLRKLKYDIEVGYNQSEQKTGEAQGAPSYKVSAIYLSGFNQFDVSVSRAITDTSFGSGNIDSNIGLPSSDGSSQAVERMDRSSADLNWQTQIICARCEFSTGVSVVEDDYLEKDEKSLSRYTRASFLYSFSKAATLSFSAARGNVDFDNVESTRNYELITFSIDYAYNFVNGVGVRLVAKNEDRTAANEGESGTYDENIYSIGLAYSF